MKRKKYLGLGLALLLIPVNTFALSKSETVYSYIDYSGHPYNTTVTNQLSFNKTESEDETELKNILNINGNETFEQKDGKLLWKTSGKDIFYEGTTDKTLPIETEITYKLEGEEVNPKKIIGKKGHVEMTLHFTNHEKKVVRVNGKNETLYTPFVLTLGTILDSSKNQHIEVTNGKVVSNGTKSIVVALASPGLYESVGYKELESLDEITISYDTTKFSLSSMYLVSTPKLLEENDFDLFRKMDGLDRSISSLQQNMDKIESGAKELESGANALNSGATEISINLKTLLSSIEALKNGSVRIEQGLQELICALENAEGLLAGSNLEQKVTSLTMLKTQNEGAIHNIVAASGKTLEELAGYYQAEGLKDYQGTESEKLAAKSNYELIVLLSTNNGALDETITTITDLSSQVRTLLSSAKAALQQLETGSNTLTAGLTQVQAGVGKLYQGSITLTDGTNKLYEGTKTLSNGTTEFNHQGIRKISGLASTIQSYSDKVEALLNLSKEYSGYASNNSNKTIFITMVNGKK